MVPTGMRIEIWSDVVCPFCYIGKRRLEHALSEFEHSDEVELVYRSFELDPGAPAVGTQPVVEALADKYGGGLPNAHAMMDRMAGMAAESGLEFDYAHATHTRTVDAHRLLHLALGEGGPSAQEVLKEALLEAYFTRGRSMGDPEVLREVAVGAGLEAGRVEQVLGSQEYADKVAGDVAQARAYGISGVPFYVLDGRLGVSGAQPVEVFVQALEQAWRAAADPAGVAPAVG